MFEFCKILRTPSYTAPLLDASRIKKNIKTLREKCPYSDFFCSVFSHIRTIRSEFEKVRTRKTPNTDTFYAVKGSEWEDYLATTFANSKRFSHYLTHFLPILYPLKTSNGHRLSFIFRRYWKRLVARNRLKQILT